MVDICICEKMNISGCNIYLVLVLEYFLKGSRGILQTGTYQIYINDGWCPDSPHEGYSMTLNQCLVRCSDNSTCEAVYYTQATGQCRLREKFLVQLSEIPLQSSPSTLLVKAEHASGFDTVVLGADDVLTYRITYGMSVTHQTALQFCQYYGAHLLQMNTQARRNFFQTLVEELYWNGPYWLDVTNKNAVNYNDINEWKTEDGQGLAMTFWAHNQPQNPTSMHCVIFHADTDIVWVNMPCTGTSVPICEI